MTLQEMYRAKLNSPETNIIGTISATATQFTVVDVTAVTPDDGIFPILLMIGGNRTDCETVRLTAIDGNTLTVERGYKSAARAWPADGSGAGEIIAANFGAQHHNAFVENIETLKEAVENGGGVELPALEVIRENIKSLQEDLENVSDTLKASVKQSLEEMGRTLEALEKSLQEDMQSTSDTLEASVKQNITNITQEVIETQQLLGVTSQQATDNSSEIQLLNGLIGVAGGLATLGDNIKLPLPQLPAHTNEESSILGCASASEFGHARAATQLPLRNGVASVGTDKGVFANEDHVHPESSAGEEDRWARFVSDVFNFQFFKALGF